MLIASAQLCCLLASNWSENAAWAYYASGFDSPFISLGSPHKHLTLCLVCFAHAPRPGAGCTCLTPMLPRPPRPAPCSATSWALSQAACLWWARLWAQQTATHEAAPTQVRDEWIDRHAWQGWSVCVCIPNAWCASIVRMQARAHAHAHTVRWSVAH